MKKLSGIGLVLALVLGLSLPLQSASDKPRHGGALTVAIRKDLTVMNALVRTSSTDREIRQLMFESLLGIDLKGNLQPRLAETSEISKDGKVVTFNLRKGVRFHNGQEMTAEDAKFAMDYTMNPKNGAYGYSALEIVERVEAPDKHTLRVHLKKPSPGFLYSVSSIRAFSVIPKGSLEEGATKPRSYPPGTGPFQFTEWKPRQQLVLARHDNYWGSKSFVDRLILKPIPDATVRMTALRAGDVDLIEAAPWEWVRQIIDGKLKGIKFSEGTDAGFRVLKFNVADPPFNNKKLRLAVAHALNKKELLQATYFGFGAPTDQRYPKGHAWYFEEARTPTYDLERAKALLKEARYKGETIEFSVRQGEQETEATTVQAQLKRIGMNVKLNIMDYGSYTARQRSGEFAMIPSGGDYESDPLATYGDQFICPVDLKKRTANDTGYCDKEMDSLIHKAETEVDTEKRRELVRRIVEKLVEDVPEVPVGFVPRFFAFRDHLKGFRTDRQGQFQWLGGGLSQAWLDK
jgi:peptide/nickel transport system substrate-binding protein